MKRIPKWVPYLLLLPMLLLMMVNGFYSFPMGDDLTYSLKGQQYDLWTVSEMEYRNWNGRYISNIFVVLNPMRWGSLVVYRLIPFFILSIYLCSVFQLVRKFVRLEGRYWGLFILVFGLLYLQGMPILSEGFYWYTGSVTYLLGLSFFNLFVSCRLITENGSIKSILLASLFLFFSSGSNEVLMLWSLVVTFLFVLYRRSGADYFLFGSAVILGCVVYFAPGNSIRTGLFGQTHDISYSSFMTFLQIGRFSLKWFLSYSNLALILVLLSIKEYINVQVVTEWKMRKRLVFLLVLFVCLLACSIFPAYWSTGSMGQHRTVNLSYQNFLLLELVVIGVLPVQIGFYKKFEIIYLSLFIVCIYLTGNTGDVCRDLWMGRSKMFAKEMHARWNGCEKNIDCLPAVVSKPKSLLNYELTSDTLNWKNTCYRDFFRMSKSPRICQERNSN